MIKPQTLKGFRDFLPIEARKRQYVINTLKKVFESYGFEPLETPALEYEEILLGKYGDEGDKLMYRFEDNGKRKVALRYDQTVPLARVVAQYQNGLPMPFKRYQIQNVWRADNTQKGRFREFLQCDIDIVGTASPSSDAEIITVADKSLKALGFTNYKFNVNDRRLLLQKIKDAGINENLSGKVLREIDKIDKIGWLKLKEGLQTLGLSLAMISKLDDLLSITQYSEQDQFLIPVITDATKIGVSSVESKLYLARGLDYYTGLIFEVEVKGYNAGSIGGGGRYDNLIGMFAGKQVPAVGFAFGFDRLVEAMEELNLFPTDLTTTKVLVTVFPELRNKSLEVAEMLRNKGVNTEVYLEDAKLEKQLKYTDQKQIPYCVIIGSNEAKDNSVTVKDLKNRTQKTIPLNQLPDLFK